MRGDFEYSDTDKVTLQNLSFSDSKQKISKV